MKGLVLLQISGCMQESISYRFCLKLLILVLILTSCKNSNQNNMSKEEDKKIQSADQQDDVNKSLSDNELSVSNREASLARWLGVSSEKKVHHDFYGKDNKWRVNLYAEEYIVTKAEVDLNRDGNIDEEWYMKNEKIYRKLIEKEKTYLLEDSRWVLTDM